MPHWLGTVGASKVSSSESKALQNALRRAVEATGSELLTKRELDSQFSGTTSVTALIRGEALICANVGDSRAIIGQCGRTGEWSVASLTEDHKPDRADEAVRIRESGGLIEPYKDYNGQALGPLRIWKPNTDPAVPGLSMTRSIGDKAGVEIGLTHTPEITAHTLTKRDKFLILATDGLWEFLDPLQIVRMVVPFWEENRIGDAVDALMKAATQCWQREDDVMDDITVVLAFLNQDTLHKT
jgi:serine/threonine protein phosphatase PrpC